MELNLTMHCNLRCTNCNRLCHMFPERTEHMTLPQVSRCMNQIRASNAKPLRRMKVLGGEPLVHPDFLQVYEALTGACSDGLVDFVKIDTNHTLPIPVLAGHPKIKWTGKRPGRKLHLPVLHGPIDYGLVSGARPQCQALKVCGYSLDKYGWLPCSPAIMIVRVFGYWDLYKRELPTAVWGLDKLCKHCVFNMPEQWQREHYYPLGSTPAEYRGPAAVWREALAKYDPNIIPIEEF